MVRGLEDHCHFHWHPCEAKPNVLINIHLFANLMALPLGKVSAQAIFQYIPALPLDPCIRWPVIAWC